MSCSWEHLSYRLDSTGKGFSSEFQDHNQVNWEEVCSRLVSAVVMPAGSRLISFCELGPWKRTGTETYSCVVDIVFEESTPTLHEVGRLAIVKAIVSPITSVGRQAEEWVRRALVLGEFGVTTGVFGSADGCVYQQFYPLSLEEYLVQAAVSGDADAVTRVLELAASLGKRVGRAGFCPISLLPDLRMANEELAVVDLGEDLGQERNKNCEFAVFNLLNHEIDGMMRMSQFPEEMAKLLRSSFADFQSQ